MEKLILVIALGVVLHGHAAPGQTSPESARGQLVPFRDSTSERWGYRQPDGRVAIPPRYLGAGVFRGGHAPVKDEHGFAVIDNSGRVVQRIATDSVAASSLPVPPPADACAWIEAATFPSTGLECYIRQLRGSAEVVGGRITITPGPGQDSHTASIVKLPNGVVVVEDTGYEGVIRRVLLPAVTEDQARQWRLKLYPDRPGEDGCSEAWSTGAMQGGAFIEQHAGC